MSVPDTRKRTGDARSRLLTAARELFTEHGYQDTPIDRIFERAGVSRGALYHHFENKRDLFAALLEEVETEITEAVVRATLQAPTPEAVLRAGCLGFLELTSDPTVRQIALVDAPNALGWSAWREVETRHAYGLILTGLRQSVEPATVDPELIEYHARSLLATLIELGLIISDAPDPQRARELAGQTVEATISQLTKASPS